MLLFASIYFWTIVGHYKTGKITAVFCLKFIVCVLLYQKYSKAKVSSGVEDFTYGRIDASLQCC